jgi:hypothetical protein
VEKLKAWLETRLVAVSEKSTIATAIRYGLNRWDGLVRFRSSVQARPVGQPKGTGLAVTGRKMSGWCGPEPLFLGGDYTAAVFRPHSSWGLGLDGLGAACGAKRDCGHWSARRWLRPSSSSLVPLDRSRPCPAMGDGVLIYFGYPAAHEDDAERAGSAGAALHRGPG